MFSTADSGEEYIVVDGNVGDRNNLSLWNNGDELVCRHKLNVLHIVFSHMFHIDQSCC